MTLDQPLWLLLLLLLPLLVAQHRRAGQRYHVALRAPRQVAAAGLSTWRTRVQAWLAPMRWLAIGLMALAMARPQQKWQEQKITADAVDIMLAMDISPSMLSRDFVPDRLAASKRVAINFVDKRPHDRIGLVAFSAEAFTQCPLTTDRRVVEIFIQELQVGRLEDGTAIGMGLATAINRLKDSEARSRIVVLLTDGENNAGYISPVNAAEMARALGIRVYTIGLGTDGVVLSPVQRNPDGSYEFAPRNVEFNTALLEDIAAKTGGKFYRAWSEMELEGIYAEIDRLEKSKITVTTMRRTTDLFPWLLGAVATLLLLELLLRWGLLRSLTT